MCIDYVPCYYQSTEAERKTSTKVPKRTPKNTNPNFFYILNIGYKITEKSHMFSCGLNVTCTKWLKLVKRKYATL